RVDRPIAPRHRARRVRESDRVRRSPRLDAPSRTSSIVPTYPPLAAHAPYANETADSSRAAGTTLRAPSTRTSADASDRRLLARGARAHTRRIGKAAADNGIARAH